MGLFRKFRSFTAEWGWEEIVPASGSEPSGDRGGALFTRNGSGVFVLHGGRNSSNFDLTDLWTFNATSKTWTQVASSGVNTTYRPAGYIDASGNLFAGEFGNVFQYIYKININTGAISTLTKVSGVGPGSNVNLCAVPSLQTMFVSGTDINYYVGGGVGGGGFKKVVVDAGASTYDNTALTTPSYTSLLQSSSMDYYSSTNTLYMVAPTTTYTSSWSLGTSSWIKYDLTAATGWVTETGITNNAGGVAMAGFSGNANQLLWCAAESKFFLFTAVGRVITYDPASKVMSEALFDGSFPTSILGADGYSAQRGNAGTVVVTGSEFFFIKTGGTNARIWKFRRN